MGSVPSSLAKLEAQAAHGPREQLAALVGSLERVRAIAWARLTTPAERENEAGHWITPDEAAEIAKVAVRVIYEWSRGKKWASRPSRRCLRIDEQGFRTWLANRR
jgi:hypothetical protein